MTKIDELVKNILYRIISYNGYYISKGQYNTGYLFRIDDIDIKLDVYKKCSSDPTTNDPITFTESSNPHTVTWNISRPDKEGYTFYLTINDRQYVVPPLDRMEEATIITRLERILQDREMNTLFRLGNQDKKSN